MPLTILPGESVTSDAPAAPKMPSHRAPLERLPANRRLAAGVVAGVVVLGAGGMLLVTHKGGPGTPQVLPPPAPMQHAAATSSLLAPPHTRAQALAAATRIFPTLTAQLPGWTVSGATKVERNNDNDPVSRKIERCLGGTNGGGISVDSPTSAQTSPARTVMNVNASLEFVRTRSVAAADLAAARKSTVAPCVARVVLNRTIPVGRTASMRFTSMKRLHVPNGMFGWQFDGAVQSNVLGTQSIRIVTLGTVHHATEIQLTAVGFGTALPLKTDLHMFRVLAHRTAHVVR